MTFSAGQLARLQAAFPGGACDWSQPGVEQQEAVSPLMFGVGPGGQPLPPAPVSRGPWTAFAGRSGVTGVVTRQCAHALS